MLFLREVEAAFLEQVPQHVKVESYVFLPLALVDEPAFFEVVLQFPSKRIEDLPAGGVVEWLAAMIRNDKRDEELWRDCQGAKCTA